MQSSLVAEYKSLEAASMLLCASFHSCSVPKMGKKNNTLTTHMELSYLRTKNNPEEYHKLTGERMIGNFQSC